VSNNKARRPVKRGLLERGVSPVYKGEPSPQHQRNSNNSKSVSPGTVLQRHFCKYQISGHLEERQKQKSVFPPCQADISRGKSQSVRGVPRRDQTTSGLSRGRSRARKWRLAKVSNKHIPEQYPPYSMHRWVMKQIKSNFHALHLLKTAKPKLRKGITSKSKSYIVKRIAECILFGNVTLTECGKRKLRKHKTVLRTIAYKRLPLTCKKKMIVKRGGILFPLLGVVLTALVTLLFKPTDR
jgi:hypothetical protein